MKYLELFAGAGGMSHGLHAAGFEPAALVEWDAAAAGVLAQHWPTVPLFADVTQFSGHEIGDARVDLLAFGSPCQDLSVAGKQEGLKEGTRSSLFFHAIRIARQLRLSNGLRFLLWENVVGALSSNQGADFAPILGEMADLGARDIAWRVLDSQWFGVAQRRRRVFVVVDLGGERAAEVLSLAEGLCGHPAPRREAGQKAAGTLSARTDGGGGLGTDTELDGGLVAPTVTSKWAKGTGGPAGDECQNLVAHPLLAKGNSSHAADVDTYVPCIGFPANLSGTQCAAAENIAPSLGAANPTAVAFSGRFRGDDGRGYDRAPQVFGSETVGTIDTVKPHHLASPSGVRRLTPRECERLQGWPDDWTAQRRVLKLNGNRWIITSRPPVAQSDSARYKQIGNGVTSPVACWIGKRIAAELSKPS